MLKHRLISGFSIAAVVFSLLFWLPKVGAWLVLVAVAVVAAWEFYRMLDQARIPVFRFYGIACGIALITATCWTIGPDAEDMKRAYAWECAVLLAMVLVVFVRQFPQKHNDQPLSTIACTLFGVLYVPFLFNFFTRLLFTWDETSAGDRIGETGRLLFIYALIMGKVPDIGAYFIGNRFGRRKLFPRISPGKTWEGLAGGVGVAVVSSLTYRAVTGPDIGALTLGYGDALALGLLLPLVSVIGDLFESLVKRAAGVKDSGKLIPGMGGVLDVLDSLMFVAPTLYLYALLFLQ